MRQTQTLVEGQPLYERRLRGVEAGYELARRVGEILQIKKKDGVTTDVGGTFAGRGSYLKIAAAERAFEELVQWVRSFNGEDAVFDISLEPPYFWYLKDDVLRNEALSWLREEELLRDFTLP